MVWSVREAVDQPCPDWWLPARRLPEVAPSKLQPNGRSRVDGKHVLNIVDRGKTQPVCSVERRISSRHPVEFRWVGPVRWRIEHMLPFRTRRGVEVARPGQVLIYAKAAVVVLIEHIIRPGDLKRAAK
eukprot:5297830-Prymnesium_polylepis.2